MSVPLEVQHKARELAASVQSRHPASVVTLACLAHLTNFAFTDLGARYGTSLAPLISAQWQYLRFWMEHHGVDPAEVDAAVAQLEDAGQALIF